jgi:vacuolar-type H+-ATPase subunit H
MWLRCGIPFSLSVGGYPRLHLEILIPCFVLSLASWTLNAMSSPPSPLSEASWEVEVQEALTENGLMIDNMDTMDEEDAEKKETIAQRESEIIAIQNAQTKADTIVCVQDAEQKAGKAETAQRESISLSISIQDAKKEVLGIVQNAQTRSEKLLQNAEQEAETLAAQSDKILHDAKKAWKEAEAVVQDAEKEAKIIEATSAVILQNAQREAEAVLIEAQREVEVIVSKSGKILQEAKSPKRVQRMQREF